MFILPITGVEAKGTFNLQEHGLEMSQHIGKLTDDDGKEVGQLSLGFSGNLIINTQKGGKPFFVKVPLLEIAKTIINGL